MQKNNKGELATLLALAIPVIVTQASETVMLFTDRLLLAGLGIEFVAPAMSGGLTAFVLESLFLGVTGYVNTIVAHFYGAGIRNKCARSASQAVYVSLVAFPLLCAVSPLVRFAFMATGHAGRQLDLEYTFFQVIIFGSLPNLVRSALAGFFIGIGKTRIVMTANLAGMIVNIPLNYALIYGVFPFPRLEIAGSALATIVGNLAIMTILAIVYLGKKYRTEYATAREWKPDKRLFDKLLYFGMPAGIEQFLNVAAFNVFLLFMQSVSTTVAAATTITFNYDLLAFVPMLGMNAAVMSIVGRHMGERDPAAASRSTYLTMRIAYAYAGFMMLVFVSGAPYLVRAFAYGEAGDAAAVAELAETMLRLAALYTLADATNLVFSGALRGAGDTHWCMIFSVSLHWIMALSMFVMIKVLALDTLFVWGFFIGFAIALGAAFFARFRLGYWKKIEMINEDEKLEAVLGE